MIRLIEHDIIQNIGIGALALHKFTNTYFIEKKNLKGPDLALLMPVLPLLFHEKSLDNIFKKRFEGGFFSAINAYREIPAGLQQRMEDMSEQTFKSLNLAYQSKLLTYNKELNEILPIEIKVKTEHYNSEIKKIISGADRLGYWFASLPFEQICIMLKIKF
ncbi:MAG TPA: three component ABC system middle component [Paludibacter sp.]